MAAGALIDWDRPWLAPYREFRPLLESAAPRQALTQAAVRRGVATGTGLAVSFVGPADAGTAGYEAHIERTGRVPTRDGRHDLFNALAWLAFPHVKAQLNAHHAAHRAAAPGVPGRGPARDAATLLDENGLLLACADDRVAGDLRAMRWDALFVEDRARFGAAACPLLLGHALADRLANPYKAICAHAWLLPVGPEVLALEPARRLERLDRMAAGRLAAELASPRVLLPLPVLGIPGWWPDNERPGFYRDGQVFRASRGHAGRAPA